MTDKDRYDAFASEFVQRFDDLVQWAIKAWPNREFPLMESDFAQSRAEIAQLLGGDKLGDGSAHHPSHGRGKDEPQYTDVNPSPWP